MCRRASPAVSLPWARRCQPLRALHACHYHAPASEVSRRSGIGVFGACAPGQAGPDRRGIRRQPRLLAPPARAPRPGDPARPARHPCTTYNPQGWHEGAGQGGLLSASRGCRDRSRVLRT
jgi:hypothetical protein